MGDKLINACPYRVQNVFVFKYNFDQFSCVLVVLLFIDPPKMNEPFLGITTRRLAKINGNTDIFFSSIYCSDIYQPNFSIANSIGKHRRKYIVSIYRGNHNRKRWN